MTQIPNTWNDRLPLWVAASHKLGSKDDPFTTLEIQQLGFAERLLLDLESRAITVTAEQRATNQIGPEPRLLSDLITHSRLWVLGLYEALRTVRERVGPTGAPFFVLADVFRRVELARMPLAKHEPKGLKRMFYPDTLFHPERGWIGWNVQDGKSREITPIFRTELANEFLSLMM